MRTFDADYINHNNHRKHAKRLNNRVSVLTHYSVAFEMIQTPDVKHTLVNVEWISARLAVV